jgi:hypothetical protein
MGFRIFLATLSLFLFLSQIGEGCPIHERNREIFAEVVKDYLATYPKDTQIFCDIDLIGKEALQRGLDLSCYTYGTYPQTKGLYYKTFTLWEGEEEGIDVLFLLFVWPSEKEALKCDEKNEWHATTIHSHPIPCAYTVMSRAITECCYQRLSPCDRRIRLCGKQIFHLGEKGVDLNQEPFIHQLLFEGEGREPAITLHTYGSSSLEKLHHIFAEAQEQHEYPKSFLE